MAPRISTFLLVSSLTPSHPRQNARFSSPVLGADLCEQIVTPYSVESVVRPESREGQEPSVEAAVLEIVKKYQVHSPSHTRAHHFLFDGTSACD